MDKEYKMGDAMLGRTTIEKDVGVIFSADMKVLEQCEIAASKDNQILGLTRRTIASTATCTLKDRWRSYHKKDICKLERIQRRAAKMIPELRDLSYESHLLECGLTTQKTRRLTGNQIEVFKIVNCYEDIDRNMFFKLKEGSRTRGHKAVS